MWEAEASGATLLSRLLGPYAVLRGNRDLQLLFGGQVVSAFGDWLYILAQVVLAYDLTGSATLVAALTFVRLLPYALFLPFVLILALGVSDVFSDVASTTVLQTGTPDELLGRVFGAFESTLIFSMLIGAVVIGPLIDLAGPRAATVILTLVSVALLIVCLPRLRRMEDALGVRVFFRQVPVLASLPHRVIDDFASLMRLEKVPAGTDIVRQGERGGQPTLHPQGRGG